jgi:hypothetical protein
LIILHSASALRQQSEGKLGRTHGQTTELQPRMVRGLNLLKSLSSLVFLLLLTACSGNAATEVPSTADAETVSPQVILERALASTKEQLSYCFTYEYKAEVLNATRSHDSTGQRLRTPQEGIREDIESVTFGKYQAPSQFETTGSTTFATDNETITISRDAITIGVTVYTKIPSTGEWKVETRDSVPETPLDRMPIDPSLLSNLAIGGEEQLDGVDVLHLVALVPPGMDIGLADPRLDRRVEYWIGKDDHLVRRYVFTGTAPGEGGFTDTITLSDFGKLVEISAPEVPSKVMSSSSRSSLLPGSKNLAAPPRQYLA